jgi:membrane protein involved in colicin uptake
MADRQTQRSRDDAEKRPAERSEESADAVKGAGGSPPADAEAARRAEEEAAAKRAEEEAKAAAAEPRYDVTYFVERSRRLFDVSPHAVRGALAGDSRKTWTEAQAQQLVAEFGERADSTEREA